MDNRQTTDSRVPINNISIQTYFCPEDWCETKIINELRQAEHSIRFMTFSFTSNLIAQTLEEMHDSNISVVGLMDKRQNSRYSKYSQLLDYGINVTWHAKGGKLHHKVFIVDESIVITGSFNPTKSADTRNDENLLIIYDKSIAEMYLEEFNRIWNQ